MEVEREPRHLGAEPARDPLGRGLAEPAERSDVVRPDEDVERGHGYADAVIVIPPRAFCVKRHVDGIDRDPESARDVVADPDGERLAEVLLVAEAAQVVLERPRLEEVLPGR